MKKYEYIRTYKCKFTSKTDLLGQAKEYIQCLEKDNHLKILKASDKKLLVELKAAFAQNTPVLIEEVFSELDHVLSKF